jgi:hypothetical protein
MLEFQDVGDERATNNQGQDAIPSCSSGEHGRSKQLRCSARSFDKQVLFGEVF